MHSGDLQAHTSLNRPSGGMISKSRRCFVISEPNKAEDIQPSDSLWRIACVPVIETSIKFISCEVGMDKLMNWQTNG